MFELLLLGLSGVGRLDPFAAGVIGGAAVQPVLKASLFFFNPVPAKGPRSILSIIMLDL